MTHTRTSRTLHANGLQFSALEAKPKASKKPMVLCLHGFPDHARSFRFQLPALADAGFHAIAPMLRGLYVRDRLQGGWESPR